MPISFACKCGQRLSARDDLQGKTTKCPKCGEKLTIPAAQAEQAPAAEKPPPPLPAQPKQAPPPLPADPKPVCPGCGEEMAAGAVLCVKCGYNTKLGRRMQTEAAAAEPPPPARLPEAPAPKSAPAPASKSERRGWIVSTINKGLAWLTTVALIAGFAAFGYFVGGLGDYLGQPLMRYVALGFVGFEGLVAVWATLLHFVISASSPTAVKTIMILTMLAALATYGCLVYLVYQVRRAIEH